MLSVVAVVSISMRIIIVQMVHRKKYLLGGRVNKTDIAQLFERKMLFEFEVV